MMSFVSTKRWRVGALQLRQDERLSERNFLKLMAAVLARLPSLLRHGRSGTDG
jgi:hypothetical protein